jgi:translation initiation factor 2B subunit (eIF-2B alpha/beta/delta family)
MFIKLEEQLCQNRWRALSWKLWHGKAEECESDLSLLKENISDSNKQVKIEELGDYLKQNQKYLVDYHQPERIDLP